jgi:hypothetical protein
VRAIETEMSVAEDGKAVIQLQLPPTVTVGKHRAVVVMDDHATVVHAPFDLPVHDFGPWPVGLPLRRERLYGDEGR